MKHEIKVTFDSKTGEINTVWSEETPYLVQIGMLEMAKETIFAQALSPHLAIPIECGEEEEVVDDNS